jgi:UDP-4-amino-4,6-dideoxy-N-acetyl-beta-L-altrosamine transaminase
MIPYGRQDIDQQDLGAVKDALLSPFLTQGPLVGEFEEALANYVGAQHAVAVNSATSALHIGLLSLGVGHGDVVWTSPISFVATSNAALYCGAAVEFVDIELSTFNMSVDALEEKLKSHAASGKKMPKVVIPVHMAGQPCDMAEIWNLGQKYGFKVLEDASHALGSSYANSKTGSLKFSDMAVFSFHPVKMITTGEGGAVVTNDIEVASTLRMLRSHGITRDPIQFIGEADGPWYYEQQSLGFNYRITDFQCALGLSQLSRLDEFVSKRNCQANSYFERLKGLPFELPVLKPDRTSSFHLFIIRTNSDSASRRDVYDHLKAGGVAANVHYIPIYKQPYYKQLFGQEAIQLPMAERYYATSLSLPIFPSLTKSELETVTSLLAKL